MLTLFAFSTITSGCASRNVPEKDYDLYQTPYVWGGKFYRFKDGKGAHPEEVKPEDLEGCICMKAEDWADREMWIDWFKHGY